MNAQRHAMAMVFTAATLAFAGSAMAGLRANKTVQLSLTARSAFGSLASAYNSSDTKSWVVCSLQGGPGSTQAIECSARDASGTSAMCHISSPPQSMVQAVLNLSDNGVLSFQWDERGECTMVMTYKDSTIRPRGL